MDSQSKPRILGLDVGMRRIGVAVSDPLGLTAQGLETIERKTRDQVFASLGETIAKYQAREIVVGLPLRMNSQETAGSEKIRDFASRIERKFALPVHLWDERLTSAQANRLLRETNMSIRRRGQVVDQMAAVLILQSWMDMRQSSSSKS